MKRPRSLAEVVSAAEREGDLYARLREFLDAFYSTAMDRAGSLAECPPPTGNAVQDAYLAACAEYLAVVYRLPVPNWAAQPSRFLDAPVFFGPDGMRAIYLVESPIAFRRRNLFVSYDPLARPRRHDFHPQPFLWGRS